MKIILISGCSTCPHGSPWTLEMDEYMCSKLIKINKDVHRPLPECPLDDAAKKIKEMFGR
jgi:hypothetical protein